MWIGRATKSGIGIANARKASGNQIARTRSRPRRRSARPTIASSIETAERISGPGGGGAPPPRQSSRPRASQKATGKTTKPWMCHQTPIDQRSRNHATVGP
jgi:hypothetical protein